MVASLWDKPGVASHIEAYWDSLNETRMREEVARWIAGHSYESILDVGCGSARMAPLLDGCSYSGVDGSYAMLELARKRAPHGSFRWADILTPPLPSADKAYDAALCMHVLRHLPDYKCLLSELERVTKRWVFIVDGFHEGDSHHFGSTEVADQTFPENGWSLPLVLADISEAFPGWDVFAVSLLGVICITIGAPQ